MADEPARWKEIAVILFLLAIVALNILPFLSIDKLPFLDPTTGQVPRILALKESVQKYGDLFPLWNPYLNSGEPIYDGIFQGIDSLTGLLTFIFPTFGGINLSFSIPVLLSAIFMYLLARYLFKDPLVAALVAFVYSSAGYIIIMLVTSSINQLIGFALNPLILLFLFRAFKEKNWHFNAVLSGIFLALQIRLAPDMKITLFLFLALTAFFIAQLIRPDIKRIFVKTIAIGLILCIVGAGLAADKILLVKDTVDSSNRVQLTYEESSLRKTSLGEFFSVAIQPIPEGLKIRYSDSKGRTGWFAMGIVATLLALVGLALNWKKRLSIFLFLTLLLCVLVVTASPFFYFLWKYVPPWGSFRYVERGFSMWSLGISLAMGLGIVSLSSRIRNGKSGKNIQHWQIVAAIGLLLALNILVFNRAPTPGYYCDIQKVLNENPVWMSLKDEPGYFRVHEFETRGIDWPADPYVVNAGLEHLYGYTSTWIPEYLAEYLVAAQQSPAKFWGIMNVKYVSSMQPVNISGFKLVKQFAAANPDSCVPKEELRSYGPYLYENEEFLPRAQISRHAILLIGNSQIVSSATYQIMLNDNFKPANSVIIMTDETPIEKHSDIMNLINAVILTSSDAIDQSSEGILTQFKQQGGKMLPDVIDGKTTVEQSELASALNSSSKNTFISDSSIVRKNFDHIEISLNNSEKGFLVLSERFFYFKGWKANIDGKPVNLLRADGFVTAIPLRGGEKKVVLTYEPASFKIGLAVLLITLAALICYFSYFAYKKTHKDLKSSS